MPLLIGFPLIDMNAFHGAPGLLYLESLASEDLMV